MIEFNKISSVRENCIKENIIDVYLIKVFLK